MNASLLQKAQLVKGFRKEYERKIPPRPASPGGSKLVLAVPLQTADCFSFPASFLCATDYFRMVEQVVLLSSTYGTQLRHSSRDSLGARAKSWGECERQNIPVLGEELGKCMGNCMQKVPCSIAGTSKLGLERPLSETLMNCLHSD